MANTERVLQEWEDAVAMLLKRTILQGCTPPLQLDVSPPFYAKKMFKLVALDEEGVATSIYDGATKYYLGATVYQDAQPEHGGGLYVYRNVEDCLKAGTRHFPSTSRMADAPRAIGVVLAWNADNSCLAVSYGTKKAYSYLQLVDMLPVPPTWRIMCAPSSRNSGAAVAVGTDSAGPGLVSAARPKLPMRPRALTGSPEALSRAQANTIRLEMEVAKMEEQLHLARRVLG